MNIDNSMVLLSDNGEINTICTRPEFKNHNICRSCENSRKWRCDSGWCIDKTELRNGIANCGDLSDEEFSKLQNLLHQCTLGINKTNNLVLGSEITCSFSSYQLSFSSYQDLACDIYHTINGCICIVDRITIRMHFGKDEGKYICNI